MGLWFIFLMLRLIGEGVLLILYECLVLSWGLGGGGLISVVGN